MANRPVNTGSGGGAAAPPEPVFTGLFAMHVPPGFPQGSLPGPGQPPGPATASGSSGARPSIAQHRDQPPLRRSSVPTGVIRRHCAEDLSR